MRVCHALCIYVNEGVCVHERVPECARAQAHMNVCVCEWLCMMKCMCAHHTCMRLYAHVYMCVNMMSNCTCVGVSCMYAFICINVHACVCKNECTSV